MDYAEHVEKLPYAQGKPEGVGVLKQQSGFFKVNEQLSFEPSAEGEHEFLLIEKTELNSEDVVKLLSQYSGLPRRAISFAGMKDKQAVTTQWFSLHLPGKTGPDWAQLEHPGIQVNKVTRHNKKLKKGAIKCNQFEITLSKLVVDRASIERRIELIKQAGVPNYFMTQRFGYQGQNLARAYALFLNKQTIKNRKMKGFFLSSARSYLFNLVLAQRVKEQNWNTGLTGDAFILDGTRQFFYNEVLSENITNRLLAHDIHPSGPMYGTGEHPVTEAVKQLEEQVLNDNAVFCDGLRAAKVESARRALRVVPGKLEFNWLDDNKLCLSFELASGSYATAVIRELINTTTGQPA
ncbi:MAG: tRNA pseudouridine(13) synthase TruD [Cycloclasticus sp.]|nr:tRNA pseudouridine(13) synthase TruD [Cycloclasticus sp.]MBQ0789107.1 tRNA pseudouridine(13) synthase TruD [Cycloclasticus sp.]